MCLEGAKVEMSGSQPLAGGDRLWIPDCRPYQSEHRDLTILCILSPGACRDLCFRGCTLCRLPPFLSWSRPVVGGRPSGRPASCDAASLLVVFVWPFLEARCRTDWLLPLSEPGQALPEEQAAVAERVSERHDSNYHNFMYMGI